MIDVEGLEILIVEDNPADARLIVEVFNGFQRRNNLIIAKDGAEAMDYLYKKGKYSDKKCPSLIILDLNLPKKNGREILKEIKNDPKLKRIPVVVLTTSTNQDDINYSYDNYASAYLTKPGDFDEFTELIQSFEDFWLKWTILPECLD